MRRQQAANLGQRVLRELGGLLAAVAVDDREEAAVGVTAEREFADVCVLRLDVHAPSALPGLSPAGQSLRPPPASAARREGARGSARAQDAARTSMVRRYRLLASAVTPASNRGAAIFFIG